MSCHFRVFRRKFLRKLQTLKGSLRGAGIALLIVAMSFLIKTTIKKSDMGEELIRAGENYLTSTQDDFGSENFPIILNIARLPLSDAEYVDQKLPLTSRLEIYELMQKVAIGHPRSIGVDVDFSPEYQPYSDHLRPKSLRYDSWFFQKCLLLTTPNKDQGGTDSTRIPVYLGVYETLGEPSTRWLTIDEADSVDVLLGASIMGSEDTRVSFYPYYFVAYGSKDTCLSLAYRMWLTGKELAELPHYYDSVCALNVSAISSLGRANAYLSDAHRDFPMVINDPSMLDSLTDNELVNLFSGRHVLLGNTLRGDCRDYFTVPGLKGRDSTEICGVYLHASALMTYSQSRHEIKSAIARFVTYSWTLFVIHLLIVMGMYYVHLRLIRPNKESTSRWLATLARPETHFVSGAVIILVCLVVGVLLAKFFHYAWTELFISIPVMLIAELVSYIHALKESTSNKH